MCTCILKPGTQTRHTWTAFQRTMHLYNHTNAVLSQGMFMYMCTLVYLNQALKQGTVYSMCSQTRHTNQAYCNSQTLILHVAVFYT